MKVMKILTLSGLKKKYSVNDILFFVFTSIFLETTDLKIGAIKISELILLLMIPFVLRKLKTINFYIFLLFIFFSLVLIKTILQDFFTTFYINSSLPFLKQPFLISISRYVEYLCCIVCCIYIINYFKVKKRPSEYILNLLNIQFVFFCIPFAVWYIIVRLLKVPLMYDSPIVYNTAEKYGNVYRLKGFYIEGGPYGLFLASLIIIYDIFGIKSRKKNLIIFLLILQVVFMASSKAGMVLLLLYFSKRIYTNFLRLGKKLRYITILILLVGALYGIKLIMNQYAGFLNLDSQKELLIESSARSDDVNGSLIVGRIPAMVIVPNMLKYNWLIGIGVGNYSLLRNNPIYRGVFPEVDTNLWDLPSLGGMVDMLLENGTIFFIFFAIILYLLFRDISLDKRINSVSNNLFFVFLFLLFLGVQLYFLYLWIIFSLCISFYKRSNSF